MAAAPQPRSPIDDPLLARLDRLAQRRAPVAATRTNARGESPSIPSGPPFIGAKPVPRQTVAPAQRSKRRHPAKAARIGALAVSCVTTGGLSLLFATSNASGAGASGVSQPVSTVAAAAPTAPGATPAAVAAAAGVSVASTATTGTIAPAATTAPRATTAPVAAAAAVAFDGAIVNTRYGPVQVQIHIANGTVTDVAVVQYPSADRKSRRISEIALPILHTEALTAQSARVDTVSGATYTSDGYTRSLQSAIDAASAAGITLHA